MTSAIKQKLVRLSSGAKPRVLDLFAGCGGLSLGFQRAGFEIVAAVENDPDAARSHGINFHTGDPAHTIARDITETSPLKLAADLKLGPPAHAIDIIIGGPPCQAFTRVGRSKLREVADHPEAYRHDPRAELYLDYSDYVAACEPLAVLMENVPDMLNHGGQNLAEEICEVLSERGYVAAYTLLNAALYGVPQMRERMFLVAYRREVASDIQFPQPTNWTLFPSGYEGTRAVALKLLNERPNGFSGGHFIPPPESSPELPDAVSAEDALGDLPVIDARALLKSGELRRGARRFDQPIHLQSKPHTEYARLMREWPGYESSGTLTDHVIRYLPRDYALFARLQPGDQYPEAYNCAELMFKEQLGKARRRGVMIEEGSKQWHDLRASIVPPYDPGKFPNKWRKMEADRPARTLMAHLGKDSYSHIHYDSNQARTISVREAARLQSFPDGFRFAGTMNPAFRQIGNAVPPLLAQRLAEVMMEQISSALQPVGTLKAAVGGRR